MIDDKAICDHIKNHKKQEAVLEAFYIEPYQQLPMFVSDDCFTIHKIKILRKKEHYRQYVNSQLQGQCA